MPNLFDHTPPPATEEHVELLAQGKALRIERIVSSGYASAPNFWYDQELDEWVVLLQGEAVIRFADGKSRTIRAGDWLFLPAGLHHRLDRTSLNPPCIWLAVHGHMEATPR